MMNTLFQKQAALSPKSHNFRLTPTLINISISTRNYLHFRFLSLTILIGTNSLDKGI